MTDDWRERGLLGPPVLQEEYAEYQDGGDPALRLATVLFLDLLGTALIRDVDAARERLLRMRRAVTRAREWGNLTEDLPQIARWFSDNLVLAKRTVPGMVHDTSFGSVVISAAWVQLALVMEGLASRGGIAYDGFYGDEEFMYGPALNGAYELESRIAVYPRIVLGVSAVGRAIEEVQAGEEGVSARCSPLTLMAACS